MTQQFNAGVSWRAWLAGFYGQASEESVWHLIGETRLMREGSLHKRRVTFARCGARLFFLYEVTPTNWVAGRWCKRCQQHATALLNMLAWTGAL